MLAKPQAVLEDTKLILTFLALQMLIFCGDFVYFVLKIRWQYFCAHDKSNSRNRKQKFCHVSPYKNKFKKKQFGDFYGAWSPNGIPGVTTKASGRCWHISPLHRQRRCVRPVWENLGESRCQDGTEVLLDVKLGFAEDFPKCQTANELL